MYIHLGVYTVRPGLLRPEKLMNAVECSNRENRVRDMSLCKVRNLVTTLSLSRFPPLEGAVVFGSLGNPNYDKN